MGKRQYQKIKMEEKREGRKERRRDEGERVKNENKSAPVGGTEGTAWEAAKLLPVVGCGMWGGPTRHGLGLQAAT